MFSVTMGNAPEREFATGFYRNIGQKLSIKKSISNVNVNYVLILIYCKYLIIKVYIYVIIHNTDPSILIRLIRKSLEESSECGLFPYITSYVYLSIYGSILFPMKYQITMGNLHLNVL